MLALNEQPPRRANLIGIGAPRTATSSLARMLGATRKVFIPAEKEVNGFGIDADMTEARYGTRFADARSDCRYLADISPVYLSSRQAAERIRSYNPEAKIIATLREPVSRVISQYRHMKAKIDPSLGPELALDIDAYLRVGLAEIRSAQQQENSWYSASLNIAHSFYGSSLRRYYDLFPKDQIMVLIYEDLVRPRRFWETGVWEQDLRKFLGIKVSQRFWDNRAKGFKTAVSDEVADELKELFAAEVTATSELVGRDLNRMWGY